MAADMWSVGAVTTALFLGRSYFMDPEDSAFQRHQTEAILNAIAKCNMDDLDHNPIWQEASQNARNFIKKVLVLDEVVRLKVRQALQQKWFVEEDHKEFLQKRYQQAIRGWIPSKPALDFEEDLDQIIAARRSGMYHSLCI